MVLLNSIQYNSLIAGVMWNRHNITVSILDSNLFAPNNTYNNNNNCNTSFIYATCTVSWSKWDELLFITFMHFDIICLSLWPTHFSYVKMYVNVKIMTVWEFWDMMIIMIDVQYFKRCPQLSTQLCHHMETFSTFVALCKRNLPVTSGLLHKWPVMQSFDVFIIIIRWITEMLTVWDIALMNGGVCAIAEVLYLMIFPSSWDVHYDIAVGYLYWNIISFNIQMFIMLECPHASSSSTATTRPMMAINFLNRWSKRVNIFILEVLQNA